jgi:hypothetical protein
LLELGASPSEQATSHTAHAIRFRRRELAATIGRTLCDQCGLRNETANRSWPRGVSGAHVVDYRHVLDEAKVAATRPLV